ncbi:MAG: shikimate kinase [Planctomycetaceae bacterium]
MRGLTLIGYRGCGKSSVAAALAPRIDLPAIDADEALEERAGMSIAELIATRGEPAFRDLEAEVLADLLAGPPAVLATGGGVVLREANRLLLQGCGRPVVWLRAPAGIVRARLAADPTTAVRRPGLSGTDPLAEVEATIVAREPLYAATADVAFDTAGEPPEQIAGRIVAWLVSGGAGTGGGPPERLP